MASDKFSKFGFFAFFILLSGCERQVSFSDDIQPIFQASCIACHDKSAEGYATSGFSLGDYESVMKGTNFGPVVIAKSSISSTLYLVIASKTSPKIHMPPHHDNALAEGRGVPLSEHQIKTVQKWIDQGAQNN